MLTVSLTPPFQLSALPDMADTIEPLPLSDHMYPMTSIIMTAALIVAGRLDTEVLRVAFTKLVDTWPKLGTRMAKGENVRMSHPLS